MDNQKGFTLLEVLIVLIIMATLTALSSQSIQQAIKNKIKIQAINDETSKLRDALKIIEKDINLIFHYQDLEVEMFELIKKKKMQLMRSQAGAPAAPGVPGAPGQPSQPQTPYPCPDGNTDPLCVKKANRINPVTGFLGKEDEIAFITFNTARVSEGSVQADFVKVGYSVRGCKKQGKDSGSSQCLLRRESVVAEGDVSKGGEEVVLLENIQEFKIRYYGIGKQDWASDWAFNINDPKSKYPDAIEVSLSVKPDPKKDPMTGQIMVPIRFVNNTDEKATQ